MLNLSECSGNAVRLEPINSGVETLLSLFKSSSNEGNPYKVSPKLLALSHCNCVKTDRIKDLKLLRGKNQ